MELYQLEYFKRVVEECNITRAAESLRIAQPALSQQIKKLEAECGTSLLVRGRKQTIPTPAGQHLYERAQIISDMVDQTLSSIQEMNILKFGTLKIATIPSVSSTLLPSWISEYRNQYPNIDIVLKEGTSAQVEQWIKQSECEIGFSQMPTTIKGIDVIETKIERFVVLLPKSHNFAHEQEISFSKLKSEPMILYRGGRLADFVLGQYHSVGWEPKIICETSELATLRALVSTGIGIAILPELAVLRDNADKSMTHIPMKDKKFKRIIGVIQRKDVDLSAAAKTFVSDAAPFLNDGSK